MIYLVLIIPVLITLGFYIWKKNEFVWWEFFVPILITLGIIVLTKFLFDTSAVTFREYWGSTVVEVYESEPWNRWVHKTCSKTVSCGKDCTRTVYYDCSYQDDNGPQWYGRTNINESVNISESTYERIKTEWGGSKNKDRTRKNYSSRTKAYHSSGTKFEGTRVGQYSYVWKSTWDNKDKTRVPYTSKHKYENRIKASDLTVFNISVVKEGDVDTLHLIRYPEKVQGIYVPTILGDSTISYATQKKFRQLNAKFGPTNQVRLWILVYRNAPSMVGEYQKNYWVRGNKNELVVTISLDENNEVQWANSFSWALSEELTTNVKRKVIEINKFDEDGWHQYSLWMNENLSKFERRHFDEFSYIKIKPSLASIITIVLLSIASSIGFNFIVTTNEIRE